MLRAWLSGAVLCVTAAAADVAAVVKGLEQRYNRASTLQARFEQIHLVAGRPRRVESGTLTLRKPGRMRWEYDRPPGKLFVCDGRWVWLYSPGAQQVERARLKEADDFRAPLAFLIGRLDLRRTFSTFELEEQDSGVRLSAWPKNDRMPFTRVDFFLNRDFGIERLVIHQVDATAMEFRFSGERLNVPVDDSAFRFQPPSGVPVVDTEPERW
jgi:outer membrane lipoprotein carrier protein